MKTSQLITVVLALVTLSACDGKPQAAVKAPSCDDSSIHGSWTFEGDDRPYLALAADCSVTLFAQNEDGSDAEIVGTYTVNKNKDQFIMKTSDGIFYASFNYDFLEDALLVEQDFGDGLGPVSYELFVFE